MDKYKYIRNANLLISDSENKNIKDIFPLTRLKKITSNILPSFKYLQDGFFNLISGLGGKHAKSTYSTYKAHYCINDSVLNALWTSNGVARKITNVIPDDSTKNGITIKNDNENILLDKFNKINSLKEINLAHKYCRHFGGSLIVIGANDGKLLYEPLNLSTLKSIDWLKTYARTDIYFTNINFTEDINSPNYGQPEFYTIVPKYTSAFNVHYSRVLEFKGLSVPTELDIDYKYYWGMSVLEPLWDTLKKSGCALENVDQLLYEITIGIYKIKGLANLICEGNWELIKSIINTADLSKSTINALLQDSEDDYRRDSITFTGIKEIIEIFMAFLSCESEIPVSRLFGKQLGGLNNEGTAELTTYYDKVKSVQENELLFNTQKLVDYISLSKELNNKVKNPIVNYNSPWQLTQKEELENRKLQVEIDHQQIEDMVISPEQVTKNRLLNGWNYEMGIKEEDMEEELEIPSIEEKE